MKTVEELPQAFQKDNKNSQVILYIIICFASISTFIECKLSRNDLLHNHLLTKFHNIDGDHLTYSKYDDFIYYYTQNMNYSKIEDPLFGFSHECGLLKRKVQYCQWKENPHVRRKTIGNQTQYEYYYTYHKYWLDYQIPSLLFHNPIYLNPNVNKIEQYSYRNKKIQAGAYSINTNMEIKGKSTLYIPTTSEIKQMEENNKFTEFKYAGGGIFYSSYKKQLLDELLRISQFFDLYSDSSDWCTPGDRRIWLETWEPKDATVLGLRSKNKINAFIYNNKYLIGSVYSGAIDLQNALNIHFDNNNEIKWLFPCIIICYFVLSVFLKCPDFYLSAYLLFCIFLGNFWPAFFGGNSFTDFLLSACCGFCATYVNLENTIKMNYKFQSFVLNINDYVSQDSIKFCKDNFIPILIEIFNIWFALSHSTSNNVRVGNSDNGHDTIVNNNDDSDSDDADEKNYYFPRNDYNSFTTDNNFNEL